MLEHIATVVIDGKEDEVVGAVRDALESGVSAQSILNDGLIQGMDVVGQRFGNHEMFLPSVLLSANVMRRGLDILRPELVEAAVPDRGKVVIATVEGDIHCIGKNLVAAFLEGAGFAVVDLGVDVPTERIVDAITNESAQILGLSSLLTTTMRAMQDTIEVLVESGIRDDVKVLVGGSPITREFAESIGADGFAPNAAAAAAEARKLVDELGQ